MVEGVAYYSSQEEFRVKVEMLYRLFLMVDMSKQRSQDIISGGCAKFSPVAFS